MTFIPPLLLASAAPISLTALTVGSAATTPAVVESFFRSIFLHPGENMIAVGVLIAVPVLLCIALAFLVKKVYEHYNPS
ncbi:MAG: hypothetical protein S4CHLAM123_04430 [Chlamydiales bacterium]|nr:hypothetical protein [Chlamydiales bacterium]